MQRSHTRPVTSAAFDDPDLVAAAGRVPLVRLARTAGLTKLAQDWLRGAHRRGREQRSEGHLPGGRDGRPRRQHGEQEPGGVIAFHLTRAVATLTGAPALAKATTATIRRTLIHVPAREPPRPASGSCPYPPTGPGARLDPPVRPDLRNATRDRTDLTTSALDGAIKEPRTHRQRVSSLTPRDRCCGLGPSEPYNAKAVGGLRLSLLGDEVGQRREVEGDDAICHSVAQPRRHPKVLLNEQPFEANGVGPPVVRVFGEPSRHRLDRVRTVKLASRLGE